MTVTSTRLALERFLNRPERTSVTEIRAGKACVRAELADDSLWLLLIHPEGDFAVRAAWSAGGGLTVGGTTEGVIELDSPSGPYGVELALTDGDVPLLSWRTTFTSVRELISEFAPRDLYPLQSEDGPVDPDGQVLAAQRGLNTGLLYGVRDRGSFLYVQDWTPLNDFFRTTETRPDGLVGGDWPELGYAAPSARTPLSAGKAVVTSAGFLSLAPSVTEDDTREEADRFLQLLRRVYRTLSLPSTESRDWGDLAQRTARDLAESPLATTKDGGYRYVLPYVGAEVPDSMVQLTTLLALMEYDDWRGEPSPLAGELRAGLHRFFDPDIGIVRRYLATVPEEKDADLVDSWYLYHPIANLGRLALLGDAGAETLFRGCLDAAIRIAHRFDYRWPVEYDLETLQITKAEQSPGQAGQPDAGGLYAFVMMEAHELTGENRYLDEAKRAIAATRDRSFDLVYQTNLTSWGLNACLRIHAATGDADYRDQALVFLASFLHNCAMWDSDLRGAAEYPTFFGVTCLHDGPYFAPYECYESFLAFHEALVKHGDVLPDHARDLMAEFVRYAPYRGWSFYPENLPETALAYRVRNGTLSRELAFPLEDLYADGQPAGQVGQEVYGCGSAFAYLTHTHIRLPGGGLLWLEYPAREVERTDRKLVLEVLGGDGRACGARLVEPGTTNLALRDKSNDGRFTVRVGDRIEATARRGRSGSSAPSATTHRRQTQA